MIEAVLNFLRELTYIWVEMAPYLLLGFIFAGLLHVLFPKQSVARHLGKSNRFGVLNAALLGIPLPLCSCGVIPTGISFYKHGASKASTVSFFISTPQTGADSILVTYSLLGLPFAIIRPVVAFISGIIGGVFTGKITGKEPDHQNDTTTSANGSFNIADQLNGNRENKFLEFFRYAFLEFLQDISKWLIIGMLLAAFFAVLIPDDFFGRYLDRGLLSMLVILVASIPLYICATGSVPIAAVLMLKGLSPGAALVLLMAGPATNMATITMISKVLGKKALTGYLISIISMALVFGILTNLTLPEQWFLLPVDPESGHIGHHLLPQWLKTGSALLLILLIVNGYLQRYKTLPAFKRNLNTPGTTGTTTSPMQTKIIVNGMTCNHCKANVEQAITSVSGIEEASVDLSSGEVLINGNDIDLDLIRKSVEDIGYEFAGKK